MIAGAGKDGKGKSSSSTDMHVEAEDILDEAVHEIAPVVVVRDPGGPTPEEKALHDLLHLPHRSWCEICVKARGKEDPHFKKKNTKAVPDKPVVTFDYKSFGREIDKDDKLTAIVVRYHQDTIFSCVSEQRSF